MSFRLLKQSTTSQARRGEITTSHGVIQTPAFMPDATRGAVQSVSFGQVREAGIHELVTNTLHLYLRPGEELLRDVGGFHALTGWDRPVLTDGGGFQIYSLIHRSNLKGHVDEQGMTFQSPLDGSMHLLSPERSQEVQFALGSDIMMAFDDCIHADIDATRNAESVRLTTLWSRRARDRHHELRASTSQTPLLYAIVQGGNDPEQRTRSFSELAEIGFDGYAYGGWPVDSDKNLLEDILGHTADLMPADKPRYAMGVGTPDDIRRCVQLGYDLFDCVLPTRNGRHGFLYTSQGIYRAKRAEHKTQDGPVDPQCDCHTCQHYSRAYLRHLFSVDEQLAATLGTIHNLRHYGRLLEEIRADLEANA